MAPQDTESQFKFLLACIKHSANGKINFEAVAGDLGIVSKAAAAKRYERLLKAHNIVLTPSNRGNGEGSSRARANAPAPKAPRAATRKRAIRDEDDDSEDIDNIKKEEGGPSPLKKNKVVSALAEESDEEFTA